MTRYNTIQDLPEQYQEQAKTKRGEIKPPTPNCNEKTWLEWVIREAKNAGWALIYHTHNSKRSEAGFPDLIMLKYTPRGKKAKQEIKNLKPKAKDFEQFLKRLSDAGIPYSPRDYVTFLVAELKTDERQRSTPSPAQREWLTAWALTTNHTYIWRPSMWKEILEILQK